MKTVGCISLGCSKNRVDSEKLLGLLRAAGYAVVDDPARADVIIVNTCGFIESAKAESIDAILDMAAYKTSGSLKTLIVTGCLAQRYGDALREQMPEVDAFLGVAEYTRIMEAIRLAEAGRRPLFCGEGERFYDSPRVLTTPPYSAYVKISDGCDNRCAYCAIPLIRGGYRSRSFGNIVEECGKLAASGVSELTLIAQDTSRYGNDFPEGNLLLPALLTAAAEIPDIHWLRVLYCYPDTVEERLLDTIAALPKVCRYLDLPLQHINARLLKLMNRRGTPELIRRLIAACKQRDIIVRTTMIVGFPGETEAEFAELLDFVREARFDRLGAFAYSAEEGTPASSFPSQLEEAEKQARLDRLMRLQREISAQACRARVGKTYEVLVEGQSRGRYIGRSYAEAPEIDGKIYFTSQTPLKPGEYVPVTIRKAGEYDLIGERQA